MGRDRLAPAEKVRRGRPGPAARARLSRTAPPSLEFGAGAEANVSVPILRERLQNLPRQFRPGLTARGAARNPRQHPGRLAPRQELVQRNGVQHVAQVMRGDIGVGKSPVRRKAARGPAPPGGEDNGASDWKNAADPARSASRISRCRSTRPRPSDAGCRSAARKTRDARRERANRLAVPLEAHQLSTLDDGRGDTGPPASLCPACLRAKSTNALNAAVGFRRLG